MYLVTDASQMIRQVTINQPWRPTGALKVSPQLDFYYPKGSYDHLPGHKPLGFLE